MKPVRAQLHWYVCDENENNYLIAQVIENGRTEEECLEIASLLAAAPELLDVLEEVFAVYVEGDGIDPDWEVAERARAAIAHARGLNG